MIVLTSTSFLKALSYYIKEKEKWEWKNYYKKYFYANSNNWKKYPFSRDNNFCDRLKVYQLKKSPSETFVSLFDLSS